jgi:hypothetical protein
VHGDRAVHGGGERLAERDRDVDIGAHPRLPHLDPPGSNSSCHSTCTVVRSVIVGTELRVAIEAVAAPDSRSREAVLSATEPSNVSESGSIASAPGIATRATSPTANRNSPRRATMS